MDDKQHYNAGLVYFLRHTMGGMLDDFKTTPGMDDVGIEYAMFTKRVLARLAEELEEQPELINSQAKIIA